MPRMTDKPQLPEVAKPSLPAKPSTYQVAMEKADAMAEGYADLPALRAVIQTLPYIGSIADTLIGARADAIKAKRLDAWLTALRARLEALDEAKLDKAFIASEEFASLVVQAGKAAADACEAGKVKMFADFL